MTCTVISNVQELKDLKEHDQQVKTKVVFYE